MEEEIGRWFASCRQADIAPSAPFLPVRDDFHPKRNQARQKLATLPKNRFKDLASDVFYELRRRYPEFDDDTSLYGGDDAQSATGGPPRSDSRSALSHDRKGSGLSSGGGGQMAQVLRAQAEEPKRFATPTAATSDIVVPNKSTITEEAIEVPYARDSVDGAADEPPATRFRTETPVSIRKNSRDEVVSPRTTEENGPGWHERDSFISNTTSRSKPIDGDAEERIRKEYELRVAGLERRCNTLEGEKEDLSRQLADERERRKDYEDEVRGLKERATTHASSLRSIQHELDVARDAHAALREQTDASARAASDEAGEWRSRAEALEDELRRLETEHANCGQGGADEAVVAELQGEVKSLVEELNALSVQNEDLVLASERHREAYSALEAQLAESRKQFQAARTELRNLKATSVMFTSQPMSEDHLPASPDGNIADMHVSAFQSAIDNLLQVARSSQPTGVLPAMKAIVEAVTAIGEDVKAFEDQPNLDVDVSKLESLKHDSTTRLGALMIAARNHAMASGLSPVGLIDAAAGTLSANVVEIIKLLKIRRTGAMREILKKRASMSIADMVRRTPFDENEERNDGAGAAGGGGGGGGVGGMSPRVSPGRFGANGSVNGYTNGSSPGSGYAPLSPKASPASPASPASRNQPLGHNNVSSLGGGKYETPAFQTLSAQPELRINSFQSATTRSDSFDLERKQSSASGGSYASSPGGAGGAGGPGGAGQAHQRSPSGPSGPSSGHRRQPSSPAHRRETSSRGGDREWDDVKPYLNTQSSALVSSIQSLLAAIRTGDQGQTLNQHLSEVIAISSSIVGVTRNCIPPSLRVRGDELLRDLVANTNKLSEAQETSRGEQFDKQTRQEIANYSFGVAKSLKALMKLGAE